MMSFRALACSVAIGVLAGGGAAWLHSWRTMPPSARAAVASPPGVAALRDDDLAELRAELADLRLWVRRQESGADQALLRDELQGLRDTVNRLRDELYHANLDPGHEPPDLWPDEEPALEFEEPESYFDSIEEAYRAEPVDPKWSASVTTRVEDVHVVGDRRGEQREQLRRSDL